MRECDFCGSPALDERATTCELCGSPLPSSDGAEAGPGGPEPVRGSQFEEFDAAATVASPLTPERAAAFGGPAPLRPVPERPPITAPPIVEAAELAAEAADLPEEVAEQLPVEEEPATVEPAIAERTPAEPEGDDFTDTVKPPSRSAPTEEIVPVPVDEDESESWIVDGPAAAAAAPPVCSNCGRENAAGMSFCIQCGSRLGEAPGDPVPVARLSAVDPAPGDDDAGAATVIAGPSAVDGGADAATIVSGPVSAPPDAYEPSDAATVVGGSMVGGGPSSGGDDSERTAVFGGVLGVACEVCGADNDTVSVFCVRCGARLGVAASGPEAATGTFAASGVPAGQDIDPADAPTIVPDLGSPGGPASRPSVVRTPTTRCPTCRASNDVLASFCVSCGTSLRPGQESPPQPAASRAPAAPPKVCTSCGTANEPDVRFCVSCGNSLSGEPKAAQGFPDAPTAVGVFMTPPPPPSAPAMPPPPPPPAAARDPFARTPAPAAPPLRDPFSRTPAAPPPPAPYPVSSQPSFTPPETPEESSGRFGPLMIVGIVAGAAVGAGVAFVIMQAMGVSPF